MASVGPKPWAESGLTWPSEDAGQRLPRRKGGDQRLPLSVSLSQQNPQRWQSSPLPGSESCMGHGFGLGWRQLGFRAQASRASLSWPPDRGEVVQWLSTRAKFY